MESQFFEENMKSLSGQKSSYFRFERHFGDDNDNTISEIIVEARSKSESFSRLPTLARENDEGLSEKELEEQYGYTVDGDDDSLREIWFEYPDIEDTDAESDDDFNENYGTPWHQDWYLQEIHATEHDAQKARAHYHGNLGILFLED